MVSETIQESSSEPLGSALVTSVHSTKGTVWRSPGPIHARNAGVNTCGVHAAGSTN